METKKKLRKDIDFLKEAVAELRKETNDQWKLIGKLKDRLSAFEEKAVAEADIISGKEAAKMLGYNYDYVSSTWLGKVGIKYTKGDNGCLKISRKSLEDYLKTREKTTED